jgi:glyoxylase-like metal-dependent hydrolase (beta-lactamase superfamily II)
MILALLALLAQDRPPPVRTEIAPGVHLFQTAAYGEVGLDGNSIAIITGEGVVVFDANGTPAAASAVLGEIRKLTDQPVRFLVNSHWHWDHWYGNQVYRDAFPGLRIIAHARTRDLMAGPAIEFNRPGLERDLPGYLKYLEGRAAGGDSAAARSLATGRYFLDQKRGVRHTLPDSTFTDSLAIHLGGREIRLLHLGRAVTPGDALLSLPAEQILLTGDLIVNPVTFALSGYPTEWLRALERMDALNAAITVTGHGLPLRDESLLHATMAVFRVLLREGADAKRRSVPVDEAREAILPKLAEWRSVITGNEPGRNEAFRIQLVDWYLHRVYEELDGPLDNRIAAIPEH